MTRIDCLLKNTNIVEALKGAIEYMGTSKAAEGKSASLETIYEDLRSHGVEIDLGSAAHLYQDVLSTKDHPAFNTREEVYKVAGKYFDDLTRALVLREDKTGERQISELSPREAVVKALTKAFTSSLVKDERTKSILRTMQDSYLAYAKKLMGEKPEATSEKGDTRTWQEVVQGALDKESMGYTDQTTGALNGFTALHEGAKELMKKLSNEVQGSGDETLKAQWDEYAKSFENSVRTLILSTPEGKKVLHEALMSAEGGGYVRETKDGNMVLDHQKIAGDINSIIQYRENVVNALEAHGFSNDEAQRISDALQKEYHELRGKSLELLRNEQLRKEKSHEPSVPQEKVPVGDIVRTAIKRNAAYESLSDEAKAEGVDTSRYDPNLTFSKTDSSRIMHEALKTSEYGKTSQSTGVTQIDWKKMALDKPGAADLSKMIIYHLTKNEGVPVGDAMRVSENLIENGMHDKMLDDIQSHSLSSLTSMEKGIAKEIPPVNKSEMTRLAELNSMGIFDGAHDDLMHHVLGIDNSDQAARRKLITLFEKKQQLIQSLGSHEFLYHSIDASIQRQVNHIIEANIADKGKLSKIAKAIGDYQAFVNMGIIANPFNIAENTISGFQANLGQTIGIMKTMGVKEGVKIFYEMNRLWAATLKDVAKGGIHYGMESGKFTQGSGIADKLTLENWSKLNKVQKAATLAIAYAHAGLNAMDSAYKASIHQKTTMLSLHKALTDIPDAGGVKMTKDQANEYLNEQLFGQKFADAKIKTEDIYRKLGLKADKNKIERSARELVAANLFSDGRIDDATIEAAINGSFNVAAVGLGHSARPGALGWLTLAPMMKGMQSVAQRGYDNLIKKGDYNAAAAYHIAVQTFMINGVFKFAHGVANWMLLRPLTSGLGLITGGVSKYVGKSSEIINYDDKQQLADAFQKQAQANADINRAVVGISMLALQAGATSLYGLLNKKEDKSAMASGFEAIKKNPILNKSMNKFGTDVLALMYASYNAKRGNKQENSYANIEGFIKYVENLSNIGTGYSNAERLEKILALRKRGDTKADNEAAGLTGDMLRSLAPGGAELPFYRSYKGAMYLGKSAIYQKAELPPFYKPQSLFQGLMNNGIYNDIDGLTGGHLGMYPKKKEQIEPEPLSRSY